MNRANDKSALRACPSRLIHFHPITSQRSKAVSLQHTSHIGLSLTLLVFLSVTAHAQAGDWSRFRGPNGSGISPDTDPVPVKWSDTKNLKWKIELPGPGLSSPIVVGKRVFVTCWNGYGLNSRDPGDQKNLQRHLLCIDRETGKTLWSRAVDPVLPEDSFRGMFRPKRLRLAHAGL